jgi:hypothetical protein
MTQKAKDFPHKRLAKVTSTMLGIERDMLTATVSVDYGGKAQGVGGYLLEGARCAKFVRGILRACGVSAWEHVKGRTVFVLLDADTFYANPIGLAPLPTEPGEVFLFSELGT